MHNGSCLVGQTIVEPAPFAIKILIGGLNLLKQLFKSSLLVLGLGVVTSCGSESTSNLEGHYENTTAAEMQKYIGQQVVSSEWAPSRSVIIAQPLDMGHSDIAYAMANDVDRIWVNSG